MRANSNFIRLFRTYRACLGDEVLDLNGTTEEISLVPCELTPLRSRFIYQSQKARHVEDLIDGSRRKRAEMETETLQEEAFGNGDAVRSNVHEAIACKKDMPET